MRFISVSFHLVKLTNPVYTVLLLYNNSCKRHSFLGLKRKALWLSRTKHRLPVLRQDLAGRYFHHISCRLDKTKSNLYTIA